MWVFVYHVIHFWVSLLSLFFPRLLPNLSTLAWLWPQWAKFHVSLCCPDILYALLQSTEDTQPLITGVFPAATYSARCCAVACTVMFVCVIMTNKAYICLLQNFVPCHQFFTMECIRVPHVLWPAGIWLHEYEWSLCVCVCVYGHSVLYPLCLWGNVSEAGETFI